MSISKPAYLIAGDGMLMAYLAHLLDQVFTQPKEEEIERLKETADKTEKVFFEETTQRHSAKYSLQ